MTAIQKQLHKMDPNAEDRPKSVQVAEIDIESPEKPQPERVPRTDFGRTVRYFSFVEVYKDAHEIVQENPVLPPSIQAPLASSIFRQALGTERPPPTGPALATERELHKVHVGVPIRLTCCSYHGGSGKASTMARGGVPA